MSFCSSTANIWQLVGKLFFILKIVIPILIIVFVMKDFSKAVINGDDKTIKEVTVRFIKRIVAAIVIFLIPTIVKIIFNELIFLNKNFEHNAGVCINCLTDPYNDCDVSESKGIFN